MYLSHSPERQGHLTETLEQLGSFYYSKSGVVWNRHKGWRDARTRKTRYAKRYIDGKYRIGVSHRTMFYRRQRDWIMDAEYVDAGGAVKRFTIGCEVRDDGSVGPPYITEFSERSCASGPVTKIRLRLAGHNPASGALVYRLDAPIR